MLLWLPSFSFKLLVKVTLLCGIGAFEWLQLLGPSCACVHSDTRDVSGVIGSSQSVAINREASCPERASAVH